jgi:hypothetical protein
MIPKQIGCEDMGCHSSGSGCGPVRGSCEHGNESSNFEKRGIS